MNNYTKAAVGIGVGLSAIGLAWLVVKVADKGYPDFSKSVIDGLNEIGDNAVDSIPDTEEKNFFGEGIKIVNNLGAEAAKFAIDERLNQNNRWYR